MSPEILPWKKSTVPSTPKLENADTTLADRKTKIVPPEFLLADDIEGVVDILRDYARRIKSSAATGKKQNAQVAQTLGAFFQDDTPEATALRFVVDSLARATILAESKSVSSSTNQTIN